MRYQHKWVEQNCDYLKLLAEQYSYNELEYSAMETKYRRINKAIRVTNITLLAIVDVLLIGKLIPKDSEVSVDQGLNIGALVGGVIVTMLVSYVSYFDPNVIAEQSAVASKRYRQLANRVQTAVVEIPTNGYNYILPFAKYIASIHQEDEQIMEEAPAIPIEVREQQISVINRKIIHTDEESLTDESLSAPTTTEESELTPRGDDEHGRPRRASYANYVVESPNPAVNAVLPDTHVVNRMKSNLENKIRNHPVLRRQKHNIEEGNDSEAI